MSWNQEVIRLLESTKPQKYKITICTKHELPNLKKHFIIPTCIITLKREIKIILPLFFVYSLLCQEISYGTRGTTIEKIRQSPQSASLPEYPEIIIPPVGVPMISR